MDPLPHMIDANKKETANADGPRSLTYEELFEPFRAACKPSERWAIGVESERFGVRASDGEPLRYAGTGGVTEVLAMLVSGFGWTPESEVPGGPTIILNRGRSQITLEPGGQVELSGATHADIHHVHEETRVHLDELRQLSEGKGLGWMSIGFHPLARQDQLDWVPKLRYGVMREYLATRGRHAHDMMRRTGTVQVNFDYSDEQDALRKLRVSLRLSAVVSAMFANAPFVEGRLFGGRSYRQQVWFHVDPDRQGLLPGMWNPRTTLRDYVEWALDVPMFLVKRHGQIVHNTGQTFRSYLREGFQGTRATPTDWTTHLNTLFPEVRLKNTLEMRGADAQPFEFMSALPAVWTGIVYDAVALDQAERLTQDWSYEQMQQVRAEAILQGLQTPFLGKALAHTAERVLGIAREGLSRRGRRDASTGADETMYLEQIARLVAQRMTPADRLIAGLEGRTDDLRDEILRRVRP